MKMILHSGAALALAAAVATPVGAQSPAAENTASCDAKYYGNLVGKEVDRARSVSSSRYRLLSAGAAAGQPDSRRMTIIYDSNSRRIVDVTCG